MPHLRRSRGAVAFAALFALAATGARADLTAEDVWAVWQSYAEDSGQVMAFGATDRDGDTLAVSDVRITTEADDLTVLATIDRIVFTEQGDGTVAVAMDDSYPMLISLPEGSLTVSISHPGLRLVVSEAEDGLLHSLNAPELVVGLDAADLDDIPAPEMRLNAVGVAGSYTIPTETGGPVTSDLTIAAVNAELKIEADGDMADIEYAATGMRLGFEGAGLDLLPEEDDDDLGAALRAGLRLGFDASYDTMRYRFEVEEDGERTDLAGNAVDGRTRFVMDADEFAFESASRNGALTVVGSELPLPEITLTAAQLAYGLSLPVSARPEPQEMSVILRAVDLVLPDSVWALFDPTELLPRGPATAVLDLGGSVVLPADLFSDETAMAAMMGGPAAAIQLESLTLSELLVRFGGAALTGVGAFTFDNTDLTTFPGMPRPTGTLDLSLRGGTTLLEALVAMGVLPEDQAMGARMMLALFTRPGEGPDELLSTLEVREDGAVFANGMRLQ